MQVLSFIMTALATVIAVTTLVLAVLDRRKSKRISRLHVSDCQQLMSASNSFLDALARQAEDPESDPLLHRYASFNHEVAMTLGKLSPDFAAIWVGMQKTSEARIRWRNNFGME